MNKKDTKHDYSTTFCKPWKQEYIKQATRQSYVSFSYVVDQYMSPH